MSVSAVRTVAGADILINAGYILAGNNDLGSVTVKGDLGGIDVGDANSATMGLKSLTLSPAATIGIET